MVVLPIILGLEIPVVFVLLGTYHLLDVGFANKNRPFNYF